MQRNVGATLFTVVGVFGVATIIFGLRFTAFYVMLTGCLFLGIGTSMGGSTNYGFLKIFSGNGVIAWMLGSGLSGIFGSAMYILLKSLKIPSFLIFVGLLPLYTVYGVIFLFIWTRYKTKKRTSKLELKRMSALVGQSLGMRRPVGLQDLSA